MDIYNVIITDEDNLVSVTSCTSEKVAKEILKRSYDEHKKNIEECDFAYHSAKFDKKKQSFFIEWDNTTIDEDGEECYADTYEEYSINGYIEKTQLVTNVVVQNEKNGLLGFIE